MKLFYIVYFKPTLLLLFFLIAKYFHLIMKCEASFQLKSLAENMFVKACGDGFIFIEKMDDKKAK